MCEVTITNLQRQRGRGALVRSQIKCHLPLSVLSFWSQLITIQWQHRYIGGLGQPTEQGGVFGPSSLRLNAFATLIDSITSLLKPFLIKALLLVCRGMGLVGHPHGIHSRHWSPQEIRCQVNGSENYDPISLKMYLNKQNENKGEANTKYIRKSL